MEIKQIYDCQEVLDSVSKIKTEEELKCDQLLRNPNIIEWLNERKNNLDKEIKEIEGKILEKDVVLSKKKTKESEKEEISKILENKINELNSIDRSEKILQSLVYSGPSGRPIYGYRETYTKSDMLKEYIKDSEGKIKGYDSDIYDKGQSKHKVDEIIKNKETNERNWEVHVSSAKSELSSAESDFARATKRGEYSDFFGIGIKIPLPETWGECWNLNSPELSSSCVQRYRKKVEEKKSIKESYERILNTARGELKGEKDKSKKLSETITSLNTKKNEEIAKRDKHKKEYKDLEAEMQGILGQKKSLEVDIGKQHAEQMKINGELLSLEENAKNLDTTIYKTQKGTLEQNLKATLILEQDIIVYQNTEMIQEEAQHQEL